LLFLPVLQRKQVQHVQACRFSKEGEKEEGQGQGQGAPPSIPEFLTLNSALNG